MGKRPKQTPTTEPTALRVRALRRALDIDSSTAFADLLGVSLQRLNNVENGLPLGLAFAMLMVSKIPGLTLDWLFLGARGGLSLQLVEKLDRVMTGLQSGAPDPGSKLF